MTIRHQITSLFNRCRYGAALAALFLAASVASGGMKWEAKPSWTADSNGWTATGPGERWDTLLSKTKQQDGSFSAVVRIMKAADLNVADPAAFDETSPGYEAGLIFRRAGDKFYRLCLSTLYKEIGLWRTDGGWLAVNDISLATNTDYRVRIDFVGERIKVFVDEKQILDVTDARPLSVKGQVGLAVKQGSTRFSAVEIKPSRPLGGATAAPMFTYRKWHNRDTFFYGLEPIARLDASLSLECKLASCYHMIGSSPANWLQYLGPEWFANTKTKLTVLETGPHLKCLIEGMTPKEEILSCFATTITFDPATQSYVYDFDTDFTVQPGKTWKNAYGLEFSDLWPHRVMGPSAANQPDQWRSYYGWIGWQSKDGKLYKHPINHSGYYPQFGDRKDSFMIDTNGGFIGFFNEDVNPVFRIVKAQADVTHALCAWGFDLHLFHAAPKAPMQEGTKYAMHFQMLGVDRKKGEEILAAAVLPPDAQHLDWEYPVFQWGVNDFRTGMKIASPHQVQLWRKGFSSAWYESPDFWDRTVGYKDKTLMRVDGPNTIAANIGPSWGMPGFPAKRYLISAMVKTENVKGDGPFLGFSCLHIKSDRDHLSTGITGTRSWTRVGFVTTNLTGLIQGYLMVGLSGTGKAWFDDVEIRALKDNEQVTLPRWEKAPLVSPATDVLVWLKMDDKEGAGAFDYSSHGSSAELHGLKWVEDNVRGPCLEFDGKGVATIESKDELDFTTPFSFTCWIKPAATLPGGLGAVFTKYNYLGMSLNNVNAPYGITFSLNAKWNLHGTAAVVPGAVWSHIAMTHDGKTVRIYVNGAKVWDKAQPEDKVMFSGEPLNLGGFWNAGRISQGFCGRMAEARFFSKALSDEDVKRDLDAGKLAKK